MTTRHSPRIFVSYSHADTKWLNVLDPHLAGLRNYAKVETIGRAEMVTRGTQISGRPCTAEEFDSGFALLLRENVQAIMLASNTMFYLNRQRIAEFMTKNHLPSMFGIREYVEAGGLMSYGESFREFYRRSAAYVDKIIKGAKAGDLPIEQPNRFYFTINLKTANAIGLELPAALVLRADEVIE